MFKNLMNIKLHYVEKMQLCQLFFLIAMMAFSNISNAFAQSQPIKIIVYGDSMTSGHQLNPKASFPVILEQKLRSENYNVNVINMSVSGETTAGGLARLQVMMDFAPDIVLVQLGINDAVRGIDIEKIMLPNLHKIIATIRSKGSGVLICGAKAPVTMDKQYRASFAQMFYNLSLRNKTSLYSNISKGIDGRADLKLADGIHPNEKGVLTMVQNIYPEVKRLVEWRKSYQEFQKSQR